MTRENFSKANEIVAKIRKLEDKLCDLHNNELKINSESETKEYLTAGIIVSKKQLQSIVKYNREVLKSQKEVLEKMLTNI